MFVCQLHIAAANGYLKCGKLLLKHGADVTKITSSSGWTALHCAAKFGQVGFTKTIYFVLRFVFSVVLFVF